jgi:hypothetical protein
LPHIDLYCKSHWFKQSIGYINRTGIYCGCGKQIINLLNRRASWDDPK